MKTVLNVTKIVFQSFAMGKPNHLIILLLLIASSCTVYKDYPIDILSPAEVDLANNIQNIAVLSANFRPMRDTSMYYYSDYEKVNLSSETQNLLHMMMTSRSLKSFSQAVSLNERFANIEVMPYNYVPLHFGDSLLAFTPAYIKEICDAYHVDAVVVLEVLSFKYSEFGTVYRSSPETNEVSTIALWRIYNPTNNAFLDQKIMIDTVFWNSNEDTWETLNAPNMNIACGIAAEIAGENYAKRITSNWEKVNRMYLVPPLEDFKKADGYLNEGKWENAIQLWGKYTDKKYGKLAIHANYNMALAYEMKDEIDQALKYINKSLEQVISLRSNKDIMMVSKYQMVLNERKADLAKLNFNEPANDELLPIQF